MTDKKHAEDWSAYWQGRAGAESGAALTGSAQAGIETDEELAALWAGVFAGAPPEARVLDLACGAGSALKAAAKAGLADLTGVDVSPAAIEALKAALPQARGVVASAAETGLAAGGFDLVCSQFGFEYAGPVEAGGEASRLLAPGGRFAAICHMKDGGIERECRRNLEKTEAILATGFADAARAIFKAAFAYEEKPEPARQTEYEAAIKALEQPRDALAALAARDQGQAAHLLAGTTQLYQRRKAYLLSDILGWLEGVEAEISAYEGRMRSMTEAALDQAGAEAVLDVFTAAGCSCGPPEPVSLGGAPAAWLLEAVKP